MRARGRLLTGALLCAVGLSPSEAQAQSSDVTAGVAAYEAGEFERAAELFDRAEASSELTRADVVRILEHRVLVAQALGDEATLDRAILRLVTLEPEALTDAAPALVRRRDAARERTGGATVEVQLEHERPDDGTVRIRPRIRGDAGGLVVSMRLRARVAGDPWPEPVEDDVTLEGAPEQVEAVAEAVGPGGAVLASIGTLDDPVPLVRRRPAPSAALAPDQGDDTALHVGLVVGGVALVAGAVALALALTLGSQPDSTLGTPMVEW